MSVIARLFLFLLLAASCMGEEKPLEKVAFGSCFKESRKSTALKTIAEWKPDLFVWMGDNIYGNSDDMAVLRAKYQLVLDNADYLKIREAGKVLATWDDHDMGGNDIGGEFGTRAESQQEFLDFLGIAKDSPRRKREGVYSHEDLGPKGKQVRVILLDTRYHRDALGSDGTILGEEQWRWLEGLLRDNSAQVTLLVSSIQILPTEHRFEKWSNFPKERARLLALLAEKEVPAVILLSGDRHLGEISLDETSCGYPLFEITSSSLNFSFGGNSKEVNGLRVGENFGKNNFGTLSFDWEGDFPVIEAAIRDENGVIERKVAISVKKRSVKRE